MKYKDSPGYKNFLGKRICPVCEKVFVPNQNMQVCCSKECKAENDRRKKVWKRQYIKCTDADYLNARLEEMLDKIKEAEFDQ